MALRSLDDLDQMDLFEILFGRPKEFQINTIDHIVLFASKVLRLNNQYDFSEIRNTTFIEGLERIVHKETHQIMRKDNKTTEWDHLMRTSNSTEASYISSFWDAYKAIKRNDPNRYWKFHELARDFLLYGTSATLVTSLAALIYLTTRPTLNSIRDYMFQTPFSWEQATALGAGLFVAWASYLTISGLRHTSPKVVSYLKEVSKFGREIFEKIPGTNISNGEGERATHYCHDAIEGGYWHKIVPYLTRYGHSLENYVKRKVNFVTYKPVGDRVIELAQEINWYETYGRRTREDDQRIAELRKVIYLYTKAEKINDKKYKVPVELLQKELTSGEQAKVDKIIEDCLYNPANLQKEHYRNANLRWRENYALMLIVMSNFVGKQTVVDKNTREEGLRFKAHDTRDNVLHPPNDVEDEIDQVVKYFAGIVSIFTLMGGRPGHRWYDPFKMERLLEIKEDALAKISGYTKIKVLKS